MRLRPLVLCVALVGCSSLGLQPDYGSPPSDCWMFAQGTKLLWVGHGDPRAFGLLPPDEPPLMPPGDIYVEALPVVLPRPEPEMRVDEGQTFCVVHDDQSGVTATRVPEGWQPP